MKNKNVEISELIKKCDSANAMVDEKVGALMRKYCLPCIIALLVGALYNIIDQIFIANASYLGSCGNAANTVVFPMTVVALACACFIGDGACAYMSLSLGARDEKRAAGSVGSAIVLSISVGLAIMAMYLLFSEQILIAFGAGVNEETYAFAKEYFFYITLGIPVYVFGQAMNPIIRSDGSPRYAMVSMLAGASVNLVFDFLFIYVFEWGMMGAAVATVIGQLLTASLAANYIKKMKLIKLKKEHLRYNLSVMKKYIPLGLTSFFSQIAIVLCMVATQNSILTFGAQDAVFGLVEYAQIPMAVIGIVMKVFQLVIAVVIGLSAGCIPLVSFNVGAGRYDRAKEFLIKLLLAETVIGLAALLAVQIFPKEIINIFGARNESVYYTQFAVRAFRVYLSMITLACVNKAAFIYLQSLGKAVASTVLSIVREVLFGVGLVLLLPIWFGLDGVLYSMPLSDGLTFICVVVVLIRTYNELREKEKTVKEKVAKN